MAFTHFLVMSNAYFRTLQYRAQHTETILLWVEVVEGEDDSPALRTEWCESIVGRQRTVHRID